MLNELPGEVLKINIGLANSVLPLIKGRIVSQGVNGHGKAFGKYSVNPLPTFFFNNKSTGKGAEDKIKALEKRKRKEATKSGGKFKGISYTEFRDANNLPTDHVTLSFTGETLADIGVVDEQVNGPLVVVGIASKNTKTKARYNAKGEKIGENKTEQILDYLGDRYGEDILLPSPEEEEVISGAFAEEIQNLFERYFA